MGRCIRCGDRFGIDEHELCLRCAIALENEMLGRIRSRIYQKAVPHNNGGLYVRMSDVNEIIDSYRREKA